MSDESRLTFEQHLEIGRRLKLYVQSIEQVRAKLVQTYPKSAKRETKRLEAILISTQLVQTSLHSRLLAEFPEMDDDELLPVYLGRLQQRDVA